MHRTVFHSLRSQLLFWLLAPLALVAALDAWFTYRSAQDTATMVQERMLLGAARMIGEQVHLEEGVLQVVIPPAALELFASPSRDRVFYRISSANGQLLSGYFDFALPSKTMQAEEVQFFHTALRGKPVHSVAFAQPVFSAPERGPVLIQVAQTLEGHQDLARNIWITALRGQLALLALVALLLWFGMRRGLRPLFDLQRRMRQRSEGALEPLEAPGAPTEIQPLVSALNDYVARLDAHMSAHSRFIADASHQLRTPLTLLNTQVSYALRHDAPHTRVATLQAMQEGVQHSVRLVNQLLAFNMAQAGIGHPPEQIAVDLQHTAQRVIEALAPIAQQRQIDLGMDCGAGPAMVMAAPTLLYELVANLVDNALRYTQQGGMVTVHIGRNAEHLVLQIEDNGPGIPEAERERVFERFYRLQDARSDGCGLGLPIVREIATACAAQVRLGSPAQRSGLLVTVEFPLLHSAA